MVPRTMRFCEIFLVQTSDILVRQNIIAISIFWVNFAEWQQLARVLRPARPVSSIYSRHGALSSSYVHRVILYVR